MIIGTREPTPLDRVVGDVVVIDAERIRASSADSLEDLLRREGGIQLSRNGGPGQSAAILLRGLGASSVLVLVDGVRVGSATLGQVDFAALGLAQIERIEILRGPGSSLYGPDAVGGVVQIITRRGAGTPRFAAHVAFGELHSSSADASVGGSEGQLDYAATISRDASRGISAIKPNDTFGNFNPDRDGFARANVQLRGGYTFAPGHRVGLGVIENRLDAQYDGVEFLPPNFTPDASPNFRNHLRTRVTALDYGGTPAHDWTTTVQLSDQADDLLSGGREQSRFKTGRQQLTWQAAWRPAEGQQLLGAIELLDEKVDATPFTMSPSRHNSAIVLGYTGAFGGFKVQADARHDRNSAYGDVDTGKLGLAFDLQPGLTLRAVAGTAFRAPTFNDL
ncbi:MAG TPA: TonB-dependent receptor, partial [Caldimonas sp.]